MSSQNVLAEAAQRALALCPAVARALASDLGTDAPAAAQVARLMAWGVSPWNPQRIAQVGGALLARRKFEDGRSTAGAAPPGAPTAHAVAADPQVTAVALRRLRRQVLNGTLVRDIAGLADLEEVTAAMTSLAEFAVRTGVQVSAHALAELHGVPRGADGSAQDLMVVAMGKGGGGELNVSSDLDLVFVFPESGHTVPAAEALASGVRMRTLSNQEFFERLGQRLSQLLSEVSADGFVFRIDLRLRPNGDAGPLAVSLAMLEEYLVRQGREWERFAWLKGRVIDAPVFSTAADFGRQVDALEAVVNPFVFRRYLDYGAIRALSGLHRLIRDESARKGASRARLNLAPLGADVKLGRGGIREVEFIAQTFQVVRGGREPRLRTRSTCAALAVLAERGVLPPETCTRLTEAYVLLRRIEHALQYVDDAQTHALPADPVGLDRVAGLLRLADGAALLKAWQLACDDVANEFEAIFREHGPAEPAEGAFSDPDPSALLRHCAALGYVDAEDAARRIQSLRNSPRVTRLSEGSRRTLDRLLAKAVVQIVAAAEAPSDMAPASAASPAQVLARLLQWLDVIVARSTYVALLDQYPAALTRVLRVLAAGPFPNDYLRQHPIVLDELLDARLGERDPDWAGWSADLEARLFQEHDAERQMNILRDAHHAQVFRLLLADLDGHMPVERLADHLSVLADTILGLALMCAWEHLPRRHRDHPAFAVIAYGKLGGKELGYASDLDLIFVFDDAHPDAPEIYALLVRRLMSWLTTATSSGVLFDVDLRLRPNGNAGLLVTAFDAFERYQRNDDGVGAWTWEHQALTRARFCAGDGAIGARFDALREAILARPRNATALRADVLTMRQKMHDGHPNRTTEFDPKHDRGGMVDVEFTVQYLVLCWAHEAPELRLNAGNIALLRQAGALGIIDPVVADSAAAAYRHFRVLQHRLRLSGASSVRVPHAEVAQAIVAIVALWDSALAVEPAGRRHRPRQKPVSLDSDDSDDDSAL